MDLGRPQQKSSARPIYYGVAAVAALTVLWLVFKPVGPSLPIVTKAVTVLSGDSDVSGTATFTQAHLGEPVSISLDLKGLDPNAKRGFHIHVSGDLSGEIIWSSCGLHVLAAFSLRL